jgi:hypothetical protein
MSRGLTYEDLTAAEQAAIPAEPPSPVITGCDALAFRKL